MSGQRHLAGALGARGRASIIAIADWVVQYEDTAAMLRGYQVALLGGTPEQRPERYAEQVRAPVLII